MKVLLLHAFPLDGHMWEPQREALATHDVYAPTLYPLGNSMDAWAEAILERVDGPFVACGSSMGGYCALALARQAPELLQGLLLAGARLEPDSPERHAGRAATIDLIRSDGPGALWKEMRPKLFPDDADPGIVLRAHKIVLKQDAEGLVSGLEAIRDRADSTDVVAGLDVPIVHAIGERDPFVAPAEASGYPGRLEVFESTGHLVSMQLPERFNRLLLDLLRPN